MSLRRRDFLRAAAAGGIGVLGASFLKFEDLARAAETPDHFFLFIELQGGTVWARTRDAGGAEFGFSLPALPARSLFAGRTCIPR